MRQLISLADQGGVAGEVRLGQLKLEQRSASQTGEQINLLLEPPFVLQGCRKRRPLDSKPPPAVDDQHAQVRFHQGTGQQKAGWPGMFAAVAFEDHREEFLLLPAEQDPPSVTLAATGLAGEVSPGFHLVINVTTLRTERRSSQTGR